MNKISIFLLVIFSCSPPCPHRGMTNITNDEYIFSAEGITESGIKYAGPIDPLFLDIMVKEVQMCVANNPGPYVGEAYCWNGSPCSDINECVFVLITDDWQFSCDKKEQLLTFIDAPQDGCMQKGFEDDPDCPCKWRGGAQIFNDHVLIVATPNFRMLRYELTRYEAGCWNAWAEPRLVKCFAGIDDKYWKESIGEK